MPELAQRFGGVTMWGIWQVKAQVWTSWDKLAAWKTREIAEKNLADLRKSWPGIIFEVREWPC